MITVRRILDRSCGAVREYRRKENGRTVNAKSEELEMDEKNYTEVLINGNVYAGRERRIRSTCRRWLPYINEKIAVLKGTTGIYETE